MTDLTSLTTVIARHPDLMTSELSDTELVMLNIERGSYDGMADTAKDIWNQLDTPRSIAAVCDQLMTQYAVNRETCEREVLAFVQEMLADELVQVVSK